MSQSQKKPWDVLCFGGREGTDSKWPAVNTECLYRIRCTGCRHQAIRQGRLVHIFKILFEWATYVVMLVDDRAFIGVHQLSLEEQPAKQVRRCLHHPAVKRQLRELSGALIIGQEGLPRLFCEGNCRELSLAYPLSIFEHDDFLQVSDVNAVLRYFLLLDCCGQASLELLVMLVL